MANWTYGLNKNRLLLFLLQKLFKYGKKILNGIYKNERNITQETKNKKFHLNDKVS